MSITLVDLFQTPPLTIKNKDSWREIVRDIQAKIDDISAEVCSCQDVDSLLNDTEDLITSLSDLLEDLMAEDNRTMELSPLEEQIQ